MDPAAGAATAAPAELSARRLHELAREAFRVGNRGRLTLCDTLRAFAESRLYFDLGFPSVAAYADSQFQLRRSETFEYLRVSRALAELTELREAFGAGRLGWTAVKAITRVASAESQRTWIAFAAEHGIERTLAEAKDALRRGKDRPREGSFGLPNLDQKLVLRFPRSDMDKVRSWIEHACATIAAATGAEHVSLEQAVLFLCERDSVDRASGNDRCVARSAGDDPESGIDPGPDLEPSATSRSSTTTRAQLVYQRCPDCRRARVSTRDGFVEVEDDEVRRYAGAADSVVIDGPTPRGLRRRILGREGQRCGNPRCDHRAAHCHHIEFRSAGGRTSLANEVAVCTTCHALIHAGLLRVTGDANGVLDWRPVVGGTGLEREDAAVREEGDRLPVLELNIAAARSRESATADSSRVGVGIRGGNGGRIGDGIGGGNGDGDPDDGEAGRRGRGLDRAALAQGLTRLGVPLTQARRLIDAAIAALPGDRLGEAAVLRRALASL